MATENILRQIHRNMLKDAVPLIQKLRKEKGNYISEDDIRDQFHAAFDRHPHRNLEYTQECHGRSDMAIKEDGVPVIQYELKTYFKENEIFHQGTAFGKIMHDINKLYKKGAGSKAYFILVCRKQLIETCPDIDKFKFIKETGSGSVGLNKKYTVKAVLSDVTIRTKHREINDDFVILSWEIEK